TYQRQQERNAATLRRLLRGRDDLLADFAAFTAAADSWRATIAVPYIARVRRGDPSVTGQAALDAGKAAFDRVRTTSAMLTDHLQTVMQRTEAERRTAIDYVWAAVIASAALILLAGVLLWRGLRVSVLAPVDRLAAQTRRTAEGAIDEPISESGPPELADLGRDVETMRARIASELSRVELAHIRLMERTDELARSNADLEQFAYVASHDLSEPLRKVANFCQLLERQYGPQLDEKAGQYIGYAVDGAKRMQALIADLLAFSRVGRDTDGFAPVDMDAVLSHALAMLEERVFEADADIVRHPLPVLDGDAVLLTALFQNLVGNALKYRSTERRLRIEIAAEREDGNWLFTIADNGIGIEPQYAERIFTIFQRLHLRDQYGGTGIGLALCRKIVEFHRGHIWLGQPDGPGATFHFWLPEHGLPPDAVGEN
ncbi:MAG TPA: ATP-binding protein, partial [Jatrophihabitantaceae bacterium]